VLDLIGRWSDLIPKSRTQDTIKILRTGQQGRAPFQGLGKPIFDYFMF